jgi:hypothetical protein
VGHAFSFGAIVSWSHGYVYLPCLGIDARGVDLHG